MSNFVFENPNPQGKSVGDCTVRAIAIASDKSWEKTYMDLCLQGYMMADMPSSNDVWGQLLTDRKWLLRHLQDTCPLCYTVDQFCEDNHKGTFILGTGTHVVTVQDGKYYDAWDSGQKTPLFYFERK